jgi:hypothetical protein
MQTSGPIKTLPLALFSAFLLCGLAASAGAQDTSAPSGEWRGQVQWYATVNAKPDPAAHSVGNLVLAVDPRGKVVISASDIGCTGLGLFNAGPMPSIKSLDITLKGCSYEGYNRRFGGTLLLQDGGRRAKVQLHANNIRVGSNTAFYEVKGVLGR